MFDTKQVGNKIKELRQLKDLTQMQLADSLEVSYQAVSNWERGNSMPDISKLADISNLLGCSIDNLLGKSKETELLKEVVNLDKTGEFRTHSDMDTLGNVAPLLKPSQTKTILDDVLENNPTYSLQELTGIAPFLSSDQMEKLVENMSLKEGLEVVIGVAPFLSQKAWKTLIGRIEMGESFHKILIIAPFLSAECMDSVIEKAIAAGKADKCDGLYPFLSKEMLKKLADALMKQGKIDAIKGMAPFL